MAEYEHEMNVAQDIGLATDQSQRVRDILSELPRIVCARFAGLP